KLETNLFDESGQENIQISQALPAGTNLATVDAAARKVEGVVAARTDVENYQVVVGNGTFNPFAGSSSASTASFNLTLKPDTDAVKTTDELKTAVAALTDVGEVKVGGDSGTGFDGSALSVTVQAADAAVLAEATEQVRQAMAGTPDVSDVTTSLA